MWTKSRKLCMRKWKYQFKKMDMKRNQKEILQLKRTIIEMKNLTVVTLKQFWVRRRINELENNPIEKNQIWEQKEKNAKRTEPKGPVGHP